MGRRLKVSTILTSFNRPQWVRQSIRSIEQQTYKNYQLVIVDESDLFDIHEVVREFKLSEVVVRKNLVSSDQRKSSNRLSININEGLTVANGDLVCFLADDDYYYPNWFQDAVTFFRNAPQAGAAFGKLTYSDSKEMIFPDNPAPVNLRFFNCILDNPFDKVDHNQAMHRKIDPPVRWSENPGDVGGPDAYYFRDVSKTYKFFPIPVFAAVKRVHPKNLQSTLKEYYAGEMRGARE